MAKPRHPAYNRPDTPEGPGEGRVEAGVVMADAEAEKRGGKQGGDAAGPPPIEVETSNRSTMRPQGVGQRRRQKRKRRTTRKRTGMEIPQGGHKQGLSGWGGGVSPPGGKRVTTLLYPRTCAPVVTGSLCRLPVS